MAMTIRKLKEQIRKKLISEGKVDYRFISAEVAKRMEEENDLSQAVTSFLKDNPNATEGDVALALKSHPITATIG